MSFLILAPNKKIKKMIMQERIYIYVLYKTI
jgi:hypothetical protein